MRFLKLCLIALVILPAVGWGAAGVVGTPQVVADGSTYTAESGANRVVVACPANRTLDTGSNITPTITAFSVGAASLANGQLILGVETAAGLGANWRTGCWYVKEANIGVGALTVDIAWADPMQSTTQIAMYTLSGVNQSTSVDTTQTKAQSSATLWQQAITAASSSVHVSASVWGAGGVTATSGTGYTEVMDHTGGGAVRAHSQYRTVSTGGSFTWEITTSSAVSGRIAIVSFAPATIVAPSFTSGPTKTADGTAGNTWSVTPNLGGDASATWYMGVYKAGQGCPSATEIVAGTGTGFVANFSKVITGADTLASTGLDYPKHDYCQLLLNSAGGSAVSSNANVFKSPPTGYLYDVLGTIGPTSWCAEKIASPAAAAGDVLEVSSPSVIRSEDVEGLDGTCHLRYDNQGARDLLCVRLYDDSVREWMTVSPQDPTCNNTPTNRAAIWQGNLAPNVPPPGSVLFYVEQNAAMTPVDLTAYCDDPEDDTSTVTCANLPAGLSCSSSTLQGTPTTRGVYTDPLFTCRDPAGDTNSW